MSRSKARILHILWVLLALVTRTGPAAAQDEPADDQGVQIIQDWGWHLGLEALTDVPIQIGGNIAFEMPYGIRAGTTLGFLPGSYVDLINAVVVAAGGYDDATADVIAGAISNSLVWRLHLGWRPWRDYGFYFEVGYTLVTMGGDVSTEDLIVVATGVEPPDHPRAGTYEYDVGSTLHMIDVEVGWELVFWRHFIVRVALGVAATVAAHTEIEPLFEVQPRAAALVDTLAKEGAAYLDDLYRSYVFPPVFSVALGYRFF